VRSPDRPGSQRDGSDSDSAAAQIPSAHNAAICTCAFRLGMLTSGHHECLVFAGEGECRCRALLLHDAGHYIVGPPVGSAKVSASLRARRSIWHTSIRGGQMTSSRFAFNALLSKVNPPLERAELAQRLPGEVRDWLADHEFGTVAPHSRLIGSYGRQTAVTNIKDVDALVFLPVAKLDRTPESVLRELKRLLETYPDSTVDASPQRRSIRLDFALQDITIDIVGAVAADGLERPLLIPDRQKAEWVLSDPLGYGRSLSANNGEHGGKLVPLVKLIKAWRDQQFAARRPKSYLLEVIVFRSVVAGDIVLAKRSTAENICDFFEATASRWHELMDQGDGVPRVADPQLGTIISASWERSHFETFMRRIREAAAAARAAIETDAEDVAEEHWRSVFGSLWPAKNEVDAEARKAATKALPGSAFVAGSGQVSAVALPSSVRSRPTTFHGTEE